MTKKKNNFNYEELIKCANGKLFGPGNAKLPSPPMLMFDRITNIADNKGIHKKGLIVLISDLFDNPKHVIESLKHFRYKKNEVIVFHLLDPQEIELKYNEQIMFEDLETREKILTEPWHIQKIYKKEIGSFLGHYQNECRKNKISYNLLTTNISLDYALSEFLNKRRKSF